MTWEGFLGSARSGYLLSLCPFSLTVPNFTRFHSGPGGGVEAPLKGDRRRCGGKADAPLKRGLHFPACNAEGPRCPPRRCMLGKVVPLWHAAMLLEAPYWLASLLGRSDVKQQLEAGSEAPAAVLTGQNEHVGRGDLRKNTRPLQTSLEGGF